MYNHLTDEELITAVDMDAYASPKEKALAMRLALALDAIEELNAEVREVGEAA